MRRIAGPKGTMSGCPTKRTGLPVATADERYSSAVVEGGRDDAAAAVILQQWFDENDQWKGGDA